MIYSIMPSLELFFTNIVSYIEITISYCLKMTVFMVVVLCSLVRVYQCFRGACCPIISIALMVEAASTSEMSDYSTTIQKTVIFILAAMRT
jgi:hypothetical protein